MVVAAFPLGYPSGWSAGNVFGLAEKKSENHDGSSPVLERPSLPATRAVLVEVSASAGVAGNEHLVLEPLIDAGRCDVGASENAVRLERLVVVALFCVATVEARLSREAIDARICAVCERWKKLIASCLKSYRMWACMDPHRTMYFAVLVTEQT